MIDRVRVPSLILHALDDPFIRTLPETRSRIIANPHMKLVETEHGGHCAFLAAASPTDDGYWAESTLHGFLASISESYSGQARQDAN